MKTPYTFKADERLKSRKAISGLFEDGNSFFCFPFRVIWMYSDYEGSYPAQLAVSVSKKTFRKAVRRNRIKRLMREAWRLHKHQLYSGLEERGEKIIIMLIYTGNNTPSYKLVTKAIEEIVVKLLLLLPDVSDKET